MWKTIIGAGALLGLISGTSQAATLFDQTITVEREGFFYLPFSVTGAGTFIFETTNNDFDTELFLFDDNEPNQVIDATDALIDENDDGGVGLASRISESLGLGGYILAVGQFSATAQEARSGFNLGSGLID